MPIGMEHAFIGASIAFLTAYLAPINKRLRGLLGLIVGLAFAAWAGKEVGAIVFCMVYVASAIAIPRLEAARQAGLERHRAATRALHEEIFPTE